MPNCGSSCCHHRRVLSFNSLSYLHGFVSEAAAPSLSVYRFIQIAGNLGFFSLLFLLNRFEI